MRAAKEAARIREEEKIREEARAKEKEEARLEKIRKDYIKNIILRL